ncbi:MAG: riboflavin synthase [Gammaproteobacteria bacterium]|nr:MAG: riboflavin synthase [Gammaproteobacteria bacterium]
MFTGIIEATGKITSLESKQGDSLIEISVNDLDMSDVKLGDSIAVNGVCLTVIRFTDSNFTADVSAETLSRSCFKHCKVGDVVNLEKALLATSRLGGHLVSGHVDGIGEVMKRFQDARSWCFVIKAPDEIAHYIAEKGSITIDGVSLTVNSVSGSEFDVNIVPHTLESTSMDQFNVSTRVNLEVDLIARYLERLINKDSTSSTSNSAQSISEAMLVNAGFKSR